MNSPRTLDVRGGALAALVSVILGVATLSAGGCRTQTGAQRRAGGGQLTDEMTRKYVDLLPGIVHYLEERDREGRGEVVSLEEAIDAAIRERSRPLRRIVRDGGWAGLDEFEDTHRLVWEAYSYLVIREARIAVKRSIENARVPSFDQTGRLLTVEQVEQAYRQADEFKACVPERVRRNAGVVKGFLTELDKWEEELEAGVR